MFCKYCGQEIADDSVFCEKCGKNIKENPNPPTDEKKENVSSTDKTDNKPDTWYYLDGTEIDGPLSADTIRKKLINGVIDYDAKVRRDPSDSWMSLIDSPFADVAIKLTPDPVSVSDKWIWCLAIIPMAVTMLVYYFKIIPSGGTVNWIMPLAINILFILLDKKELEDKGLYPEGWMWMGIVLVPIYLVVREVKTNRNFVPAVIWCFLFAVETFIL